MMVFKFETKFILLEYVQQNVFDILATMIFTVNPLLTLFQIYIFHYVNQNYIISEKNQTNFSNHNHINVNTQKLYIVKLKIYF